MAIKIEKIKELSIIKLKPIIEDSRNQGFLFVQRLVDNWIDQKNCFDQKGEVLLIAKDADRFIGLCGLNIDPFVKHLGEQDLS
ncbi:PanD maturation factor (fragment) [Hyella patelloides LEGE 07179]|uniref:PanD maturation factor n=1 Tax=Hyella patelloides LEGE 07179 TaxID=945734 RepID=A0A563VZ29_9CYAN